MSWTEIIFENQTGRRKAKRQKRSRNKNRTASLLQSGQAYPQNSRNGLGIVYVQRDACGGLLQQNSRLKEQLDIRSRKENHRLRILRTYRIDPGTGRYRSGSERRTGKKKNNKEAEKAADAE